MPYRGLLAAVGLVITLTIATGCSGSTAPVSDKPVSLSKSDKDRLIQKIKLTFIDRYPNDQGLVRVYGQLTNGTKRKLVTASIQASSKPIKARAVTYGTVTVKGVDPGDTVDFEIPTGKSLSEMRNEVVLTVKDAEFR